MAIKLEGRLFEDGEGRRMCEGKKQGFVFVGMP